MEPGVQVAPALSASAEQNHILLLGADEPLSGFRDRLRRRTGSLRSAAQELCDVTYVVGAQSHADWQARRGLLSDLCDELAADGSVAVLAPHSAVNDVLRCIGDLQATRPRGVELRAVFTETETAA